MHTREISLTNMANDYKRKKKKHEKKWLSTRLIEVYCNKQDCPIDEEKIRICWTWDERAAEEVSKIK